MQVIKANTMGFCAGVRRAWEMAVNEAQCSGSNSVYTFGPLVHNPRVLADLSMLGVKTMENPQGVDTKEYQECSLVIRTHGISPDIEEELRIKGAKIIDATCPKVKKSQIKAHELGKAGYGLFLAGEANHAEIEGILGYAKEGASCPLFCVVVGNACEADEAAQELLKKNENGVMETAKTALLGQTTISEEEYRVIGDALKKYFTNLEIVDTICAATFERQKALRELLGKAEAVIIAGGKDSANTRRLFSIAQESGKPCVLIENSGEIPSAFFGYKTIGLSAGASTPDCVVKEIEARLNAKN